MYAAASSRITDQHTTNGATDIQHFGYTYDDAGNMTSRSDVRLGLSESFTFDDLDRLTGGQVNSQTAATYAFDVVGNITEKSDAGNPFLYTSSAVHAVTGITVGASTQNLSYDPNGNLSTGDDVPTITWSSYNKPTQLTKGAVTYTFSYGPDRTRYKKTHSNGNTTYYIGSGFEQINKPSATEYRHVIRANGRAILLRKDFTAGTATHQYLHRDHLGSVTALTRESDGTVIERYSYDAWGLRRNPTTWAAANITAYEQRGYTGHEHLDDIGIIHMNGRIYNPKLGRMLSPDPVTQAPENGQNYNRYSYAYNNPLRYTDPSGFLSEGAPIPTPTDILIASALSFGLDSLFGGNGCDRTCQYRQAALNWCKSQSACIAELRANTREKFRRRSAQVILAATQTGQSYYYENGRAYLGDNTTGAGDPVNVQPVPGQNNQPTVIRNDYLTWEEANEIRKSNTDSNLVVVVQADLLVVKQTSDFILDPNTGDLQATGVVTGHGYLVHGQVTIKDRGDGTYGIYEGNYDFEYHSWDSAENVFRNLETAAGEFISDPGTDFIIRYEGDANVIPL